MGTHPIFESDFDCLTDCIKMNAKTSFAQKIKEKMKKDMPGKASALNAISEDDRGRKVWDRGEYSKMAEDRLKKDIEKATKYGPDANLEKRDLPSSMRDPVQARVKRVDLDSGVGKTKAIHYENGNNGKGSGGYYCSVCDVNVKDSRAYLNHLNGRRHQRNMGFNPYKLPESSVVGVQQRFQEKIKAKKELERDGPQTFEKHWAERQEKLKADEEWHKQYKRECKKAKKRKIAAATESLEDPLSGAVMGFASFGSKKKC